MRILSLLLAVALSGCVAYVPQPIDPVRTAREFGARTLDAPGLRAYLEHETGQALPAWPLARWDRRMLTLAAGYYHPALAAARAQREGAAAGGEAARARPNPTLDFPFEFALNQHGGPRQVTTGPGLTWTIETGGRRAARIDQATALEDAARWNAVDVAWKIRSQVRAALLATYAQTRRSEALAARGAALRDSVAMLEQRLLAGAIALPDLRRMRLQLAQAEAELASSRAAGAAARARLATAVGVPVAALDAVVLDDVEFDGTITAPEPAPARAAVVLGRADVRAALAEYDAAQAALRQEIARQYPTIQLGTGYTYDAGTSKISFGLGGISLPVFDRNSGPIAQAQARRTELAARVDALQETILNDVDASLARYRAAADAAVAAQHRSALALRQRDSVAAGFAAGAADRLELAQARADALAFVLDRVQAQVTLQEAASLLEDALQQALPANPEHQP